jgi:hypothetical protein
MFLRRLQRGPLVDGPRPVARSSRHAVIVVTVAVWGVWGRFWAGYGISSMGDEARGCGMVSTVFVVIAAACIGAALYLKRLGWE